MKWNIESVLYCLAVFAIFINISAMFMGIWNGDIGVVVLSVAGIWLAANSVMVVAITSNRS